MYIPNLAPVNYEQNFYLSRKTREEIKSLVQVFSEQHYAEALEFLKKHAEAWEYEQSPDGNINKAHRIVESKDKSISIEFKSKYIQISFFGIPSIKENRWENLITSTKEALTFPNKYLKLCSPIIKQIVSQIRAPQLAIPYRALLDICDPICVDENDYNIILSGKTTITQEEIENSPNIRLLDDFSFIKLVPAPMQTIPQISRPPIPTLVKPENNQSQPHPVPMQNPVIQTPDANRLIAKAKKALEELSDTDNAILERLNEED